MTASRYDLDSAALAARYEAVEAADVHPGLDMVFPNRSDPLALDIGAGSGRDAAWLTKLGFDVTAVGPSAAMRLEGQHYHRDIGIRWLDDRLPDLSRTHQLGLSFDLILLSGVWQHILLTERARAFRELVTLLKPAGVIVMTLRQGAGDNDPSVHPVSLGEIEELARDQGIAITRVEHRSDALGRGDVAWTTISLKQPYDGGGALPQLFG